LLSIDDLAKEAYYRRKTKLQKSKDAVSTEYICYINRAPVKIRNDVKKQGISQLSEYNKVICHTSPD